MRALKGLTKRLGDREAAWAINGKNRFTLDLVGAEKTAVARYAEGRIERVSAYERDGRRLPVYGIYQAVFRTLKWGADLEALERNLEAIRFSSYGWVSPEHWRLLDLPDPGGDGDRGMGARGVGPRTPDAGPLRVRRPDRRSRAVVGRRTKEGPGKIPRPRSRFLGSSLGYCFGPPST